MSWRASIAAGAALAILAGIVVWSAQSCRPQKVRAVPAVEAPALVPAPPVATERPEPAFTIFPSLAAPPAPAPIPPGPAPAKTERCFLLRVDGSRATVAPVPCPEERRP